MHFSDRLAETIKSKKSCLMLGLDPNWEKLPEDYKTGERAGMYAKFCKDRLDQCAKYICGIKIQMAYFEALGSVGIKAVENLIKYTRENYPELIIMMDAKRGDIGATSEAYAEAFLGENSPLAGDCVTVAPYMGTDSVDPFMKKSRGRGKAVFVLLKTSNPSSQDIQDVEFEVLQKENLKKITIADYWGYLFERLAHAAKPEDQKYSHCGVVVGATHPADITKFRKTSPSTWILAPGVGAQGGKIEDVLKIRDADGLGVLIPVSRAVLYADDPAGVMKELWEAQRMG